MRVQIANGTIFPFKWEERNVFDFPVNTIEEAAYLAVRKTHDFLTDDNHHYEAKDCEITWGGEKDHFKSIYIYHLNGDKWFCVEHRVVS